MPEPRRVAKHRSGNRGAPRGPAEQQQLFGWPVLFISKAYAKAYGVKAKEAQLVKGVGVSAKKLEDGTYCFVLTLDMLF